MTRTRPGALLLVLLVAAGCRASPADPGPTTTATPPVITTTTIDPEKTCEDLAEDAADLLEEMVGELEEVTALQFADRGLWPVPLLQLEADGVELDRRAAELGCDPAAIQAEAFAGLADLDPEGVIAARLVELLRSGSEGGGGG